MKFKNFSFETCTLFQETYSFRIGNSVNVPLITCDTPYDSCYIEESLPFGMSMGSECNIFGTPSRVFDKKEFTLHYNYMGNTMTLTFFIGIFGSLTECSYGVDNNIIKFPTSGTFTVQKPRCNTPIQYCVSSANIEGITVENDGRISKVGTIETMEDTVVDIICGDGSNNITIPLTVSVIEGEGSQPVQFFEYMSQNMVFRPDAVGTVVHNYDPFYSGSVSEYSINITVPDGVTFTNAGRLFGYSPSTVLSSTEMIATKVTASNLFSSSSFDFTMYLTPHETTYLMPGCKGYYYKESGTSCTGVYTPENILSGTKYYVKLEDSVTYNTATLFPDLSFKMEVGCRVYYNCTYILPSNAGSFYYSHKNSGSSRLWDRHSGTDGAKYNLNTGCAVRTNTWTLNWANYSPRPGLGEIALWNARSTNPGSNFFTELGFWQASGGYRVGPFGSDIGFHEGPFIEYDYNYAIFPLNAPIPTNAVRRHSTVTGTFTYYIHPTLPNGLTIDPNSGSITGIPEETSSVIRYTVTAKSTDRTIITHFEMGIEAYSYSGSFSCSVTSADVNLNENVDITCPSDGTSLFHLSHAIPGIEINENTGAISGTISAVYNQPITVFRYSSNGIASTTIDFHACTDTYLELHYTVTQNNVEISIVNGDTVYWTTTPTTHNVELVYSYCYPTNSEIQLKINNPSLSDAGSYILYRKNHEILTSGIIEASLSLNFNIGLVSSGIPVISYSQENFVLEEGSTYFISPSVQNGGKTFSVVGIMPDGLEFDPDTGAIYGTLGETFSIPRSLSISCANSFGSGVVTITLSCGQLDFYELQVNTAASLDVSSSSNTALCGISPELPEGLSVVSPCTITGTPHYTSNAYRYTLTEYTASNTQSTKTFRMVIYGTLSSCSYGVDNNKFKIAANGPFTIQPPRCNSPVKSFTTTSTLPTGVHLEGTTGSIYTEGVVDIAEEVSVTITCSDGTNSVNVELLISVIEGTGSSPLQFFEYESNILIMYPEAKGLTIHYFSPLFEGSITSSTSNITLPDGISLENGVLSGYTPTESPTALSIIDIQITGTNGFSDSSYSFQLYISPPSTEWLMPGARGYYRKSSTASCSSAIRDIVHNNVEYYYIRNEDLLEFDTPTLWPELGFRMERGSNVYYNFTWLLELPTTHYYYFGSTGAMSYNDKHGNGVTYNPSSSCNWRSQNPTGLVWANYNPSNGLSEAWFAVARAADATSNYIVTVGTYQDSPPLGDGSYSSSVTYHPGYLIDYTYVYSTYTKDAPIPDNVPRLHNSISSKTFTWKVIPELPHGLYINEGTGTIFGRSDEISALKSYKITATDSEGIEYTTSIRIRVLEDVTSLSCDINYVEVEQSTAIPVITCPSDGDSLFYYDHLPEGVEISTTEVTNNGITITGNPTVAGNFITTIYRYSPNGVGSQKITFRVTGCAQYFKLQLFAESVNGYYVIQDDQNYFDNETITSGTEITYEKCINSPNVNIIIAGETILNGYVTIYNKIDYVVRYIKLDDFVNYFSFNLDLSSNAVPALTFDNDVLTVTLERYYSISPYIRNGASSCSIDYIPADMSFSTSTGTLSGIINEEVNRVINIECENSYGIGRGSYSLQSSGPSSFNGVVGKPVNFKLVESYVGKCSISPSLASGLVLLDGCVVQGVPVEPTDEIRYSIYFINNGVITDEIIYMSIFEPLSCSYGVEDNTIMFSTDESFTATIKCNHKPTTCSATNLPNGIAVQNDGSLYHSGSSSVTAAQASQITCSDGFDEIVLNMNIGVVSDVGSKPVQYLNYHTSYMIFSTVNTVYNADFDGEVTSCSMSEEIATITVDENCNVQGSVTTNIITEYSVTITASNAFSSSKYDVIIIVLPYSQSNFVNGFKTQYYKDPEARCSGSFNPSSSADLKYIRLEDKIEFDYRESGDFWPDLGYDFQKLSAFRTDAIAYASSGTLRLYWIPSGSFSFYVGSLGWSPTKDCTPATTGWVANFAITLNPFNYYMTRGDTNLPFTYYTVQEINSVRYTFYSQAYRVPDNYIEYHYKFAKYPLYSPIPDNTPTVHSYFDGYTFEYSITPTLPYGLSFDKSTGRIYGTTKVEKVLTKYDITAYNKENNVEVITSVEIGVYSNPSSSLLSCSSYSVNGVVGESISSITCSCEGVSCLFIAINLPSGLRINKDTGVISGSPKTNYERYVSTVYGYSKNGVESREITFIIGCDGNVIELSYTTQTPGGSLSLSQNGESLYNVNLEGENTEYTYSKCLTSTENVVLNINSNTALGGFYKVFRNDHEAVAVGKVDNYVSVETINIVVSSSAVPTISYSNTNFNMYVGLEYIFTPTITNGATHFTATNLPNGMKIDPETGTISGIPSEISSSQTVEISCDNKNGNSAVVTITFSITSCSGSNVFITVNINMNENTNSVMLYDSTSTIIDDSLFYPGEYSLSFCVPKGKYQLKTTITSLSSVEVTVSDYKTVNKALPGENAVINIVADSFTANTEWQVSSSSSDGWTTTYQGWIAYPINNLPAKSSITTYYRYNVPIIENPSSSFFYINILFRGGAIVYFRGQEIYRINVPSGSIDGTTLPTGGLDSVTEVTIPMTVNLLRKDSLDIIAVEVHLQYPDYSSDEFSVDIQYVGINQCIRTPTTGLSITAFGEPPSTIGDYVFSSSQRNVLIDDNSATKLTYYLSDSAPYTNTWFKYNYDSYKYFNTYIVGAGNSPFNQYPLNWNVYGIDSNEYESVLDEVIDSVQPSENEKLEYFMPTQVNMFRSYKFDFTRRGLSGSSLSSAFGIADLIPYVCNYELYCGDLPMGKSNYSTCTTGTESNDKTDSSEPTRIVTTCNNVNGLPVIEGPSSGTCSPRNIVYQISSDYVVGYVGADIVSFRAFLSIYGIPSYTIVPPLPTGLGIDNNGNLYGRPQSALSRTTYNVIVTNANYQTSKSITFSLTIRMPSCQGDDEWETTEANSWAEISCPSGYVGTIKKWCRYENGQGVWNDTTVEDCKENTNCRYDINNSLEPNVPVTITPTCTFTPASASITPALPTGLTFNTETGSITGTLTDYLSSQHTVSFTSISGYVQEVVVLIQVLPPITSCSYGFDSNTVKIMSMYVEIAPPKCLGGQPYVFSVSSGTMPSGLNLNPSTGAITGTLTEELSTPRSLVIAVAHASSSTTVPLTIEGFTQSLTPGLRVMTMRNEFTDSSRFSSSRWSEFLNGRISLYSTTGTLTSTVNSPSTIGNQFANSAVNSLNRVEGYVRITTAGDYRVHYEANSHILLVMPGTSGFNPATTGSGSYREITLHLSVGMNYIGFLVYLGSSSSYIDIYLQKVDTEEIIYLSTSNENIYHGGYIIQHLSYPSDNIIIYKGESQNIVPTYSGVPTTFETTGTALPTGLILNELTGIITGTPEVCSSTPTEYTITAKGVLSETSTKIYISCIDRDETSESLNYLSAKYYDIESSSGISMTNVINSIDNGNNEYLIERLEIPNHPLGEEMWDGLTLEFLNGYAVDYQGYIKMTSTGTYTISMTCYDLCRLSINGVNTINKQTLGLGIVQGTFTIDTLNSYAIRVTYVKSLSDFDKQITITISSSSSEVSEPIDSYLLYTPSTSLFYRVTKARYVQGTQIINNSPYGFGINIEGATYEIAPSLPVGLLLTNGVISGTPSNVEIDKEYVITATLSTITVSTTIEIEIVRNIVGEIAYSSEERVYSILSEVTITPTTVSCSAIIADNLPGGLSINSVSGVISGRVNEAYDGSISVTCVSLTSRTISIPVIVSGCQSEGYSVLRLEYYVYSDANTVVVSIDTESGESLYPPSGFVPVINTINTFASCVPSNLVLTIESQSSLGGFYYVYKGNNLIRQSELIDGETYNINLNNHIVDSPRFDYTLDNELAFIQNVETSFYPKDIRNGANIFYMSSDSPTEGIEFDEKTGKITATLSSIDMNIQIIARNSHNRQTVKTLHLTTVFCPNVYIHVQQYLYDNTDKPVYTIKRGYQSILSNSVFETGNNKNTVYLCVTEGDYTVTLGSSDNQPWNFAEFRVFLWHEMGEEEQLIRDFYKGTSNEETIYLHLKNELPSSLQWKYSVIPRFNNDWTSSYDEFDGVTATTPLPGTTVSYYVSKISLADANIVTSSSFSIVTRFAGGIVVYANGKEIYRYNLPSGEITANTPCTNNVGKAYRRFISSTAVFSQTDNTIAIELHPSTLSDGTFEVLSLYLFSGVNGCSYFHYLADVTGSYQGSDLTKIENMFNSDPTSKFYSSVTSSQFEYNIVFEDNYEQYFNGYYIRNYESDATRKLRTFNVSAIDSNSNKVFIDSVTDYDPNAYEKRLFVNSDLDPYSTNKGIYFTGYTNTGGLELISFLPLTCRRHCHVDGEWPATEYDHIATRSCGLGTTAVQSRRCGGSENYPSWDDPDDVCNQRCSDPVGVPGEQIRTGDCDPGYEGMRYKECDGATTEWVDKSDCEGFYPQVVTYNTSGVTKGTYTFTFVPTVQDEISSISLNYELGTQISGVSINNGVITGTIPESYVGSSVRINVLVYGTAELTVLLDIPLYEPYCEADDEYSRTHAGSTASAPCDGGNKHRECLTTNPPIWGTQDSSECNLGPPVIGYNESYALLMYNDVLITPNVISNTDYCSMTPDTLTADTGLTFISSTCRIRGRCSDAFTSKTYSITAHNSNSASDPVSISLSCDYPAPTTIDYGTNTIIGYIGEELIKITPTLDTQVTSWSVTNQAELTQHGVVFSTVDGSFSGESLTGDYLQQVDVTATNNLGTKTITITIDVRYRAPSSVSYADGSVIVVAFGKSTSLTVRETLYGVTYSLTNLATLESFGLFFASDTGMITGIANVINSGSPFRLTASNRDGEAYYDFSLSIQYDAPSYVTYPDSTLRFVIGTLTSSAQASCDIPDPTVRYGYEIDDESLLEGCDFSFDSTTGILRFRFMESISDFTMRIYAYNNQGQSPRITVTIRSVYPPPTELIYNPSSFRAYLNTPTEFPGPYQVSDYVETYTISPILPGEFTISNRGIISGQSDSLSAEAEYVVVASNEAGSVNTTITFRVTNREPVVNGYANETLHFFIGVTESTGAPTVEGTVEGYKLRDGEVDTLVSHGLSFDATTGIISGSATSRLAETTIGLIAFNDGGDSVTKEISIKITQTYPTVLRYGTSNEIKFYENIQGEQTSRPTEYDTRITVYTVQPVTIETEHGIRFSTSTGAFSVTNPSQLNVVVEVTGCILNDECITVSVTIISNEAIGEVIYQPDPLIAYIGHEFNSGTPLHGPEVTSIVVTGLPDSFTATSEGNITSTMVAPPRNELLQLQVTGSNNRGESNTTNFNMRIIYRKPSSVTYLSTYYELTKDEEFTSDEPTVVSEDENWKNSGYTTFEITSDALQLRGITLNENTGVLSGTPTEKLNNASYTIRICNIDGCAETSIYIRILPALPTHIYYSQEEFIYNTEGGLDLSTDTRAHTEDDISRYEIQPSLDSVGISFNTLTGELGKVRPTREFSRTQYTVYGINDKGNTSTTIWLSSVSPVVSTFRYTEELSFERGVNKSYTPQVVVGNGGVTNPVYTVSVSPDISEYGLQVEESTGIIFGAATALIEDGLDFTFNVATSGGNVPFVIKVTIVRAKVYEFYYPTFENRSIIKADYNVEFNSGAPSADEEFTRVVCSFDQYGLVVDETTGIITGTPKDREINFVEVYCDVTNSGGSTRFTFQLDIFVSLPNSFSYSSSVIQSVAYQPIVAVRPTLDGSTENKLLFSFKTDPPRGISIVESTGEIYGTPEEEVIKDVIIQLGHERRGFLETTIQFITVLSTCGEDDGWEETGVGTELIRYCEDPTWGFMTRECILNGEEGEWQDAVIGCVNPRPNPPSGKKMIQVMATLIGLSETLNNEDYKELALILTDVFDPELVLTDIAIRVPSSRLRQLPENVTVEVSVSLSDRDVNSVLEQLSNGVEEFVNRFMTACESGSDKIKSIEGIEIGNVAVVEHFEDAAYTSVISIFTIILLMMMLL